MSAAELGLENSGLEVVDLPGDGSFAARRLHTRDSALQMEGLRRVTRAFVANPETILQELAHAAVELCGADSSGISIEQKSGNDSDYYKWVATSGKYAHFLHATLPRYPSACGVCLERARPQLFRVTGRFFELMGIEAPVVTDGILLPWQVDDIRGTIWIMAHERSEAFDGSDLRMMQVLADFSAMAVRHQKQQSALLEQASVAAAAAMANDLAHQINNPLQSLTNLIYLAAHAESGGDVRVLARELTDHIQRLSLLVSHLLALPAGTRVRHML